MRLINQSKFKFHFQLTTCNLKATPHSPTSPCLRKITHSCVMDVGINNYQASWLNLRGMSSLLRHRLIPGAWITNIVVILSFRIGVSCIPGISPELAWTLTLLFYTIVIPPVFIVAYLSGLVHHVSWYHWHPLYLSTKRTRESHIMGTTR